MTLIIELGSLQAEAEAEDVLTADTPGLGLETPELYYEGHRPGRRVKRTESFV